MSEKFYLNSDFYKISTDTDEVKKTFEKIHLTDFTEIVQMERHPSNSTLLSLPLSDLTRRKQSDAAKRSKLKMRSVPNLMKNAEPNESHKSVKQCIDSDEELVKGDIKRLEVANEIDITVRTLPKYASLKKGSRTSYFYSKLKESFYKFSRLRGEKNLNKERNEINEKLADKAVDIVALKTKPQQMFPFGEQEDNDDDNPSNELHRGITILSGKSYYFQNGVYVDQQRSEYQMSCPKTMQSLDKRSEIQTLILPETAMIPIRKDSPVHLASLKCLPTSTLKAGHGTKEQNTNEDGEDAIRSLSVDVASSSLNLSDANSHNFEPSTNGDSVTREESSSSLDSYDGRYDEEDDEEEEEEEEEDEDNYSINEDKQQQADEPEFGDELATTVALTGTTTRVSTVLLRNLIGTQVVSQAGELPPMLLSFSQMSSSAVPSSSSSSAISSYCSILLSPEYLHKRTQSA